MYRAFFKRVIDFSVALVALLLILPILLVVALVLYFANKEAGVFFIQARPGKNGKLFKILKFKTMTEARDADGNLLPDEARLTRMGRFVRSTSIDELPQLLNILKGDMSLVGPRPERKVIADQYVEEIPEFYMRLKVKAGLTGYAQVYGRYNTTPYDKVKLDITYITKYSFWLDVKILLITFKILFQKENTEGVDQDQITASRK